MSENHENTLRTLATAFINAKEDQAKSDAMEVLVNYMAQHPENAGKDIEFIQKVMKETMASSEQTDPKERKARMAIIDHLQKFIERNAKTNHNPNSRVGELCRITEEHGIWMIVNLKDGDPRNADTKVEVRLVLDHKLKHPSRKKVEYEYLGRLAPLSKQEVDRFTAQITSDVEDIERLLSDCYLDGKKYFEHDSD